MATQRVWYLHALQFPVPAITQLTQAVPAYMYQELNEKSHSEYGPNFVGNLQASPEISFDTRDIATILDLCPPGPGESGGNESMCVNLSRNETGLAPFDVKMYVRAGLPMGIREQDDSVQHRVIQLQESAFMCWESLQLQQGQPAELSCRINIASGAGQDDPTDPDKEPFLWVGDWDPPIAGGGGTDTLPGNGVTHVYTLGPVYLESALLSGVTSVQWNNNVTREEQYSDGDAFPSHQGIRDISPTITVTTTNWKILDTIHNPASNPRGFSTSASGLEVYMKRMKRDNIHYADGDLQHLKLQGRYALVTAQASRNMPAELELQFRLEKQPGIAMMTYTKDVALP